MKWVLLALAWSVMTLPAKACQTALMFAIDVSGSINEEEWRLQTDGLADALLDPDISILLIGRGVSLSAFQWSGDVQQDFTLPWTDIRTKADLKVFSEHVRTLPRQWSKGKTAIGTAMATMARLFGPVQHCARKVIDLSGDGVSNEGLALPGARATIGSRDITLNGLAIEPLDRNEVTGFKSLDVYYRLNVIVGEDAFVQAANGYRDYPRAIRLKLLKELAGHIS